MLTPLVPYACSQGLSQRLVHPSFGRALLKVDRNWTGKNILKEINKILSILSLFHCSDRHHIVLISKLRRYLDPKWPKTTRMWFPTILRAIKYKKII